jgi:L-lactate dehydrogenase complex protein LldG
MTGDARLAILARVRQAQVRAYLPESPQSLPARLAYPATTAAARRARLLEEFQLLGVEAFDEPDETGVRNRVKRLIAGKSILSWDAERLPYGAGAALAGETVAFGADARELQAQAEIGLSGCEAALAETGSLAMVSGPGRPRTASLLPITHVVVIRGEDIVQGMGEFFERFRQNAVLPYLVFITGPSRTADIELSLTLGVHGPGHVIAVIGP